MTETKKQLEDQKLQHEQREGDITTNSVQARLRKESISVDDIFNQIEPEFLQALSKLPSKNESNFFYRLFSFYVRIIIFYNGLNFLQNKKIGTEIYPLIVVVQLIIAVYIILFFSSMEDTQLNTSIANSLK